MNFNEYEQSLIKCQYMSSVCNQLLNQLETKALAKILQKNKLISDQQGQQMYQKYDRIQSEFKLLSVKTNQSYQQKAQHLNTQIKQHDKQIKKLKIQISLLNQSYSEGSRDSRLNIKKIKQVSSLQLQSVQLRKILNYQLQNLNSLQVSNIELNETILRYDKKQIELKHKIKKLMQKENQYLICKDMEQKYEALLMAKRQLVQQNALFDSQKHQQVFNKITAIAQANQNLNEMNRYQKQLRLMIQEKQFIIEEIQKRQELHKKHKPNADYSQDDTLIFQQEIEYLRKTIANRNFQNKTKSMHVSDNMEAFLNNSTPKNSIHHNNNDKIKHNNKAKDESIFKIQIQPESHLNNAKNESGKSNQKQHRNSMPNQISKKGVNEISQKPTQKQKNDLNKKNPQDFDTLEIAALQQIIKKKQSRMKEVLQGTPIPIQLNKSPLNQSNNNKISPMIRNSKINKKIMMTEPIEYKYKHSQPSLSKKFPSSNVTPNSRFIEQMIESNSEQRIQRLKNNVRFRTKKSESDKYRHLEQLQQKRKLQQKMRYSDPRTSKLASPQTTHSAIDHQNHMSDNKVPTQVNTNKKIDLSFTSMYDNEFEGIDIKPNLSEQKQYKLKYKDKLEILSHRQSSLNDVLEKIDQLRQAKMENSQAQRSKQDDPVDLSEDKKESKGKVKVFKLSSKRKLGNGTVFSRKGKADEIEDFKSEQEQILPKIQEEEESIRNTLQSIPRIEQKS